MQVRIICSLALYRKVYLVNYSFKIFQTRKHFYLNLAVLVCYAVQMIVKHIS